MGMQAIRRMYGVPAKRGGLVKFEGDRYVILGSSRTAMHLRLRPIDWAGPTIEVHPTWEMEYLDSSSPISGSDT